MRFYRNQNGWSREQLATRCQLAHLDISGNTIELIEIQARWVGDIELVTLAKTLGVSPTDLLTES